MCAAVVTWIEFNGSDTPGNNVGTAVTNLNLTSTDEQDSVPSSNAIAAGDNSYHKNIALNFSGSYTQISNARLHKSAGVYKTDELMTFSGSVAWSTPSTVDTGDDAIPVTLPGANVILDGATTDGVLPSASESESTPGYYSGSRSDLMRFQLETSASTEAGATNTKTISMTYDRQ